MHKFKSYILSTIVVGLSFVMLQSANAHTLQDIPCSWKYRSGEFNVFALPFSIKNKDLESKPDGLYDIGVEAKIEGNSNSAKFNGSYSAIKQGSTLGPERRGPRILQNGGKEAEKTFGPSPKVTCSILGALKK